MKGLYVLLLAFYRVAATFSSSLVALTLLLLLAGLPARAQAPDWQSVAALATGSAGDTGGLGVNVTASAPNGDVYLAGSFNGTVQVGSSTLVASGDLDAFVAKYSAATHRIVWVVPASGSDIDYAQGIAVSGNSVYVAGTFRSSSLTIGTTTLINTSPSTNSSTRGNGFLAKLTDAGPSASLTWVQQLGGAGYCGAVQVAATGSTVYVSGFFGSPTLQLGATTLNSNSSFDLFVARLTDAGSSSHYDWAIRAGGQDTEFLNGMALAGNALYLVGDFFDTTQLGATTLTAGVPSANNSFVAKLTDTGTTGTFDWAQAATGPDIVALYNVAVSGAAVYVGGSFSGATAKLGGTTLANAGPDGTSDVLVARLQDAGTSSNWTWAVGAGGTGSDNANQLLVQGGTLYVNGEYTSATATFGSTALTNTGTTQTSDIFLASLSDAGGAGRFGWVQQAGGTGRDYSGALSASGATLLDWGTAIAPATFGSQPLGGPAGSRLTFVAALPAAPAALPTATATALPGLALYPNPAHGKATVRLPASLGTTPATLTLLNALGRTVRTATAPAGADYVLDLVGLAPGVYAVRVRAEGGEATRRLAVE